LTLISVPKEDYRAIKPAFELIATQRFMLKQFEYGEAKHMALVT
jgi:hypothetical protein